MAINSVLNFFSFSGPQQKDGDEPSFSQATVISVLAAGALAGFVVQYGYAKYSAYRLRYQQYRKLCHGLDRWYEEGGPSELKSRRETMKLIKECYAKKTSSLNLSRLNITALPPEIGLLVNLESLDLYNTQLQQLPPEIGLLVNLRLLYLRQTQLQQLPPEIGLLTNLFSITLPPSAAQASQAIVTSLRNAGVTVSTGAPDSHPH